ncbi:MAG: hypothetical protein P0Y65_02995 [Candidatus Devosia phytovorans]|uniref:Uncharacterized protein n=1 Tax=Candidatus Devosia phytovorans TaxID=3121372 RepID=A0AAJ6B0I8_9HYPH|nr:hypothetical protein [Devosia sp.]WEK05242.1 MAG: hypothetical protein P0Y65_02995 [Devosia sp.]
MPKSQKFPLPLFTLLTAGPALIVGAGLWYVAGLAPSCDVSISDRQTAPDGQFDLVVFSRDCGTTTGPNTQAALIPAGDDLPEDAASFVSVGQTDAALDARWDGFGNIELTLPQGAEIYRQDEAVAGVTVIYR